MKIYFLLSLIFISVSYKIISSSTISYKELSYDDIEKRLSTLASISSHVILENSSSLYNLTANINNIRCSPSFFRILYNNKRLNSNTNPSIENIEANYHLNYPQILLSGEIHGNERVGPVTLVSLAEIFIWLSDCFLIDNTNLSLFYQQELNKIYEENKNEKKHVKKDIENLSNNIYSLFLNDDSVRKNKSCSNLTNFNFTSKQINWLLYLFFSRDISIVPTPNCVGYILNKREDLNLFYNKESNLRTNKNYISEENLVQLKKTLSFVDPNRDYSYDRNNNQCLLAFSTHYLMNLYNDYYFQILLTFHGGMEALGYEWGSLHHLRPNDQSPDHYSHKFIADLMKLYSGKNKNNAYYNTGTINSMVYPVAGGMEDWAYASGWDFQLNRNDCLGKDLSTKYISENNYKGENKKLNKNKSLVYLIETSDDKSPKNSDLGDSSYLLSKNFVKESNSDKSQYNSFVSRNIRLSLIGIEMLQPYVCFNDFYLVNKKDPKFNSKFNQLTFSLEELNNKFIQFHTSWFIGGSYKVDKTFLTLNIIKTKKKNYKKIRKLINNSFLQGNRGSLLSYASSLNTDEELDLMLTKFSSMFEEEENKHNLISNYFNDLIKSSFNSSHNTPASLSQSPPLLLSFPLYGYGRWGDYSYIEKNEKKDTELTEPQQLYSYDLVIDIISYLLNSRYNKFDNEHIYLLSIHSWTLSDVDSSNKNAKSNFATAHQSSHCDSNGSCHGRKYLPSDPIYLLLNKENMHYDDVDENQQKYSLSIIGGIKDCSWWDPSKRVLLRSENNEEEEEFSNSSKLYTNEDKKFNSYYDDEKQINSKSDEKKFSNKSVHIYFSSKDSDHVYYLKCFFIFIIIFYLLYLFISQLRWRRIHTAISSNPYVQTQSNILRPIGSLSSILSPNSSFTLSRSFSSSSLLRSRSNN